MTRTANLGGGGLDRDSPGTPRRSVRDIYSARGAPGRAAIGRGGLPHRRRPRPLRVVRAPQRDYSRRGLPFGNAVRHAALPLQGTLIGCAAYDWLCRRSTPPVGWVRVGKGADVSCAHLCAVTAARSGPSRRARRIRTSSSLPNVILVNDQREHLSSSPPLYVSQSPSFFQLV